MSRLKLFSFPVVVALTVFGFASSANASDAEFLGCATCNSASSACDSCKVKSLFHGFHKPCKPYQTKLCPGACFGYFQTQWHRWDNVCPIPYQGVGMSDTPRASRPGVSPAPVTLPKTLGSDMPLPNVPKVPGN
jgi:hypothetical protein